jgi:hypothetical protein
MVEAASTALCREKTTSSEFAGGENADVTLAPALVFQTDH